MKYTDIAIIGGGLAGSTAAAMLGRAGISAVLIDPHPVYPPDFRVEKLSGDEQVERFRKTGIAERDAAGRRPMTARTGSRDSATCSTSGRASNTASCTTRWSTPSAPKFPPTSNQVFTQGRSSISTSAGAAEADAVERRGDFRAPRGARQRIECRAAPPARNRTPDRQRVPFDFDRIRHRSGRPRRLRFSRPHLFLGTAERPDSLSDAVSDREPDAGQSVRLSPDRRSLAAANAPRAGADAERRRCRGFAASPASSRSPATSRSGPPISMSAPVIASPAWFWSATPSRRPVRSPAPGPTRCSPTSSGCATSIFRTGSRPTAWTKQDRGVLRRSGQDRLRRLVEREGLQLSLGVDR